ncbi:subtilisin-like protease SBT2.4 [Heracleum sosnowskyi]|uniref:Subtilisin-like protease SBT2.4 n=1 Tax=Heracleum sosnowskyi TaxID=360622 RepID=A0AAD8I844_9APIA|nr:subtilisin-like protease SBT2.4 [Heracleum sosnowskyi]
MHANESGDRRLKSEIKALKYWFTWNIWKLVQIYWWTWTFSAYFGAVVCNLCEIGKICSDIFRIAVYKAIYPSLGTLTDLVAAIDQATLDGVDILTLSIGPDEPPDDTLTFLRIFEIFMLSARKAGVFVVQVAGNHDPDLYSIVSYSPWAVGVAASCTDRSYFYNLILGNG